MSRASNYDPVMRDLDEYLSREDREPETERARCACGRFFSREVGLLVTPRQCPDCKDRYRAQVARSPMLQGIEAGRAAHIAMGSLAPVRRQG